MTPTRRGFLASLASAFVAPDPERLLWTPGARLISVPAPRPLVREFFGHPIAKFLDVGDVVQFGGGPECYVITEVASESSFFVRSKPVGLCLSTRAPMSSVRRLDRETRDWLITHPASLWACPNLGVPES